MAIYDTDHVNEEMFDEQGDMLDTMLEACDKMLDAVSCMESTATQRHYNMTSRDASKAAKEYGGNKAYENKTFGKYASKMAAKGFHSGSVDKTIDKIYDGKGFGGMKSYTDGMSDREKEIAKNFTKNTARAYTGSALATAAKAGVPVKDIYDKAAAKADKKKAIKETCLTILSMIDEI